MASNKNATPRRRKIQVEVERWINDYQIGLGPSDPEFWALIEMVDRLDSSNDAKKS